MELTIRPSTRGFAKEKEIRRHLGGISPRTLFTLRKQGLPVVKLPSGGVLYSLDAVDGWLAQFQKREDKVTRAADGLMEKLKDGERATG